MIVTVNSRMNLQKGVLLAHQIKVLKRNTTTTHVFWMKKKKWHTDKHCLFATDYSEMLYAANQLIFFLLFLSNTTIM